MASSRRWWIALCVAALLVAAASPAVKAQEEGEAAPAGEEAWQDAVEVHAAVEDDGIYTPEPEDAPAPEAPPADKSAAAADDLVSDLKALVEALGKGDTAAAKDIAAKLLAQAQDVAKEYYAKAVAYAEEVKAKLAKKDEL